jgi:glycosyltransferase involved in cell wall biosynthesis
VRLLCLQQSSIFETYGGIEYYLHDLLTLASESLGPHSVTSLIPQRNEVLQEIETSYSVIPVKKRSTGLFQKIENRFSPFLFSAALSAAKQSKAEVILAGHVSLAPMAMALSKTLGIPFWTVAYGLEVWGGLKIQDGWALRKSQKIISISHWTKSILEARGFSKHKIEVVHPGLPRHFESVATRKAPLDSSLPLKLLTVSRLDSREQYKGHDHLIQALGIIKVKRPDALPFYTIQGRGDDKARLERLVFYGGLQERVTFIDKLESREELVSLYQGHDVFVMPSRFGCWDGKWRGEGFGIVYVEAGACGLPSVAYDCGGATDIIRNGENGLLIKPDNVEGLAEALITLHDNREMIHRLGEKARESSFEKFSFASIKKELNQALGLSQSITEVRPSSNSIDISNVTNVLS